MSCRSLQRRTVTALPHLCVDGIISEGSQYCPCWLHVHYCTQRVQELAIILYEWIESQPRRTCLGITCHCNEVRVRKEAICYERLFFFLLLFVHSTEVVSIRGVWTRLLLKTTITDMYSTTVHR